MSPKSPHPIAAFTAVLFLASGINASATINVNAQIGKLRDSASSVIASTQTLWVIVYDENGDNQLPGGLGIDGSLEGGDAAAAWSAFAGKTLVEGAMIDGDRVFMLSDFNHAEGVASFSFNALDLATEGLESGRIYGLYWFPGRTSANTELPSTGSLEIGGICETTTYFGSDSNFLGMEIPPDQATVTTVVADETLVAGQLPDSRFVAITAQNAVFATWIAGFPGVGSENGFDDDPDGDGLDNGVESALGTRPDTHNPGITILSGTADLTVQSSQAKPSLSDVNAEWQWSDNLTNWHASGESNGSATVTISETVTDASDPNIDLTEVEASVSGGPLDKLFLRLAATKTP